MSRPNHNVFNVLAAPRTWARTPNGGCETQNLEPRSFSAKVFAAMDSPTRKFSILFLCTWNAARSIFAEYFMKEFGAGKFNAFSAGVSPRGEVSPVTLKVLTERFRLDASDPRSKSWHEFEDKELDFIVSVSEQAEETTHAFPGKPILANWPFPDPSLVKGSAAEIEDAYFQVASRIRYRLQLFNNLSFDKLYRLRLELKMKELGQSRYQPANPAS